MTEPTPEQRAAADDLSRESQDDERLDRYAEALYQSDGGTHTWTDASIGAKSAYRAMARHVKAVADDEIARPRNELLGAYAGATVVRDENTRLRAAITRARGIADLIETGIPRNHTDAAALLRDALNTNQEQT